MLRGSPIHCSKTITFRCPARLANVGSRHSLSPQQQLRKQRLDSVSSASPPPARGVRILVSAASPGKPAEPEPRIPITRSEQQTPAQVADKLIRVFRERQQEEWRKLIAFSKQWPKLASVVFDRLEERSKEHDDPGEQLELRQLKRRLQRVHEEIQRFDKLIEKFREAPVTDWEGLVSAFSTDLGVEFFNHLNNRVQAAHEKEEEQEALANLAVQIASLLEVNTQVAADEAAMDLAAAQFDDILKVGSIEEADRKIDDLAVAGQLSPALLLTMAKAYAGSKDTDMTREEVKDIMAHLYFKAKESFAAEQPPEVRILKHLLTFEDPVELRSALNDAFTPSDAPSVMSAGSFDQLSTKPVLLEATISAVLQAFEAQRGKQNMVGEAANLMTPEVIQRMRSLHAMLTKEFM